ncbi:hypothetical protein Rhopal_002053-T1 [Rhodotorula paludigena]|uniref:DUF4042 domain-containing protein n=1 Tax=Rhodotorula paludigena TaxID=86838 RepID=A0AAV5GEY6_9BASI|nr:hypothetical protein Rhopal_002053-T1 [Rhodotorula paludigena]
MAHFERTAVFFAQANPKALHRHWSLFLTDSPYVRSRSTLISLVEHDPSRSVQLQACAALEALLQDSAAYLAIAEDSSNKTSFTSLSTKIGETVAELHKSLAQLLTRPSLANEPDLHLSLLKLSAKLAGSAPYGRMQRPLAQQIAKAVVPSVEDANNEIAASAASTLNVIFTRYMSTGSKSYFETENLAGLACSLAGVKRSVELQTAAWIMFAALVPALPLQDWSSLVTTLSHVFDILAPPAKAAQARFLAALSRLPPEAPPLPPAYVDCLFFALTSREAPVRVAAYEALPGPALARHLAERRAAEADDAAPFNPWRPAVVFAERDTDDAARQAAIRTIGLLAKAEHARPPSRETVRDAVAVLVDALRADKASADADRGQPEAVAKSPFEGTPGQIDRGGTAWALANCCDALETSDADLIELPTLLKCAVKLAQETSSEQVCVSALRMIGSIVKVAAQEAIFKEELLSDCARTVQSGLSHTLSKIRWNAAIAASSILHPSVGLPVSSRDDLVSSLAATLVSDSSYKVRIHAVNALLAASVQGTLPEADDLASRARDVADNVRKDSEEGIVPVREKTHADLLVKRLEALNKRLTQAVTEHVQ